MATSRRIKTMRHVTAMVYPTVDGATNAQRALAEANAAQYYRVYGLTAGAER